MIGVAVYVAVVLSFAVVSLYLFSYQCERAGIISTDRLLRLALASLTAGFVGARAGYVLIEYGAYVHHPIEVLELWNGGFSSMGAAIAGGLVGLYLLARDGVQVPVFFDLLSPYLALSIVLTRIGGFIRGSSFGKTTSLPWGVAYPRTAPVFEAQVSKGILSTAAARSLPVHPTTLYEAAVALAAFVVVMVLRKKNHRDGTLVATLFLMYFTGRFFIDFARGDMYPLVLGLLTPSQLISLAVAAGCLYFFMK
ncbi:MAG: prolipoprotein diacylglyceryl transferase [Deltaproteobacteria bacterium]|nr:prolipoprotein diacylglyceryl transferase [Deltaproteobacteria bacterium]